MGNERLWQVSPTHTPARAPSMHAGGARVSAFTPHPPPSDKIYLIRSDLILSLALWA